MINKKNSLKNKILFYIISLSFFSSLALCFITMLIVIKNMQKSTDHRLLSLCIKLEDNYLHGNEIGNIYIDNTDLPPKIVSYIKKNYPSLIIKKCLKETHESETIIEIVGILDNKIYEIEFGNDNSVKEERLLNLYDGIDFINKDRINEMEYLDYLKAFVLMHDLKKNKIFESKTKSWPKIDLNINPLDLNDKQYAYKTISIANQDENYRIITYKMNDGHYLTYGISLKNQEKSINNIITFTILIFIITTALLMLISYFITSNLVKNIKTISKTAKEIGDGAYHKRVSISDTDAELVDLINSFNQMADKNEKTINNFKDIITGFAHDIKTPLTSIKTMLETFNATQDKPQEIFANIMLINEKLINMSETLLKVTSLENNLINIEMSDVDVKKILLDTIELYDAILENEQINIDIRLTENPCIIKGNANFLQRAFANILDNSIKYGNKQKISIELERTANCCKVKIADWGIGINHAQKELVFNKFYRCENSRSEPGFGLGLSLTKSIIDHHKGLIYILDNEPTGAIFIVELPS